VESSSGRTAGLAVHGGQHLPLRNSTAYRCRCVASLEGGSPMSDKRVARDPLLPDSVPHHPAVPVIESERYEFRASSPYRFELQRRDFFKFLGAGLLVACVTKDALAFQESGSGRRQGGQSLPREISACPNTGIGGAAPFFPGKWEVGKIFPRPLSQAVPESCI